MPNGIEVPQVVSIPTRCHLWKAVGLTSKDLHGKKIGWVVRCVGEPQSSSRY